MRAHRAAQRARQALDAQHARLDEAGEDGTASMSAAGMPREHENVNAGDPGNTAALRRACLSAVMLGLRRGVEPAPETLREAVRWLLHRLAAEAPGKSVEVRVPPHAAVQCVPGPRHTRGTPPNVVETDARTWLELATGTMSWSDALEGGSVRASGERSDLSPYLPLVDR